VRFEPDVLVDVPRDDDASDAARRDDGRAIPQPWRSVPAYVLLASLSLVVLSLAQRPRIAAALPTFAQAYQVDWSVCHSMVPALNAYGRYVQSTAFAALDAGILRRAVPLVVREGVNYHSAGNLASNEPNDRYTYGNLSANLVGVLNKSFSYRFEQSLYENNVGGGSTGHFWIAYNQLLHGDGHLIVGKVDAPAPPAFSYWHDASAFSSPEIAVGQHGYLLDGTRWGVGFNYVPKNYVKQPYKSNWHISETRRRSIIRRSSPIRIRTRRTNRGAIERSSTR